MAPSSTSPRPNPSPPITGTLGRTSLAELMVYLARREESGTLVLYIQGHEGLIVFEHGAPVRAYSPWQPASLGKLLVRMGWIDAVIDEQTEEEARKMGVWQGALLVARGLVEPASLEQALREQTGLRVIELFRHYDGTTDFAFHRHEDWLSSSEEPEGSPVDPWYLLWRGSRRRPTDPAMSASLSLLGQKRVLLRDDAELHRFGLGSQEMPVVEWLRNNASTVDELVRTRWLPPDRMRALLYVLFITHSLAFHEPQQAATLGTTRSSTFPPAIPRSGTMPRVLPTSEGIVAPQASPRVARQTGETEPYSDSSPPSSSEAHSARIHELKASVRNIMGSPPTPVPESDAITLEAPPGRPRQSAPPPSMPASSSPQIGAMRLLRDAQEERLHGDLAKAEAHARAAYAARASDPNIATELACILVQQPDRRQLGDLGETLDLLRSAIAQRPEMDRPYYVRGMVHQALGLHDEAFKDFREAVARNPRCIEAAEQVRVYLSRYRETGSLEPRAQSLPPPRSGLGAVISKFFKG